MATGKIHFLLPVFSFLCFSCFSQGVSLFSKDDSLLKNRYYEESVKKKNELVSSLAKEYARDYKKIYEDQFTEIGSLWKSSRVVTASPAHEYLQSLVQKIIDANNELKGTDARVVFLRDWWPNAVSMGDGTIGINAGLVVFLDNEAELIFIICHELAHYYLQHTPQSIRKYVETVNSAAYQSELKRLAKTEYGANKQLEQLGKSVMFNSRKHSRDNEAAADRYAFNFLKRTGYDCNAINSCLALLDKIDDSLRYQPLALQQLFDFPDYLFKKKWVQNETSIFSDLKETDTPSSKKEKDSLKTHPDCAKRIALLTDSIQAVVTGGKKFIVNEPVFKQLKKDFSIEIEEECYRQDNLSRNLYYSLQLMQDEHTKQRGIYAVARSLNKLYELQKNHKLGTTREMETKGFPEDYNLLLRLLDRLRLDELANLNYYFCKQYESLMKGYPGFDQEMHTTQKNKN